MKRKPKAYSREKRKEQIVNQFRYWYSKGDDQPKTLNRIAKVLELEPTQHLRDILTEMELEGKLKVEIRDQSGRWTTRFYLLADLTLITEKSLRRKITVQKRGVAVGQLEMFSWDYLKPKPKS